MGLSNLTIFLLSKIIKNTKEMQEIRGSNVLPIGLYLNLILYTLLPFSKHVLLDLQKMNILKRKPQKKFFFSRGRSTKE